jgi:hypothetical protein
MINTFETAQTTQANSIGFGAGFSPIYISSDNGLFIWPMTRFMFKYGVNNNVDIGLGTMISGWIPGLIINTKYQFKRDNLDGAAYLEGSYYGFNLAHGEDNNKYRILTLRPGVIFSQEQKGKFPYSINVGLHYYLVKHTLNNQHNDNSAVSLAANIGLPLRFGHNRAMKLMPEVGFVTPIIGSATIQGNNNETFIFETGNSYIQFGLYLGK